MKKKSKFLYLTPALIMLPLACSSPPKTGTEEVKSITSNTEAIPLAAPVEFPEDLNKVVEDLGVAKDKPLPVAKTDAQSPVDPKAPKTEEKKPGDIENTVADEAIKSDEIADGEDEDEEETVVDAQGKRISRKIASTGKAHTITYVVKTGDTLMKISFNVFGDLTRWKEILDTNQSLVTNPNVLTRGTKLKIKVFNTVVVKTNGEPYPIKKGDTLGKISTWVYGNIARWKELWNNNRELIHNPNKIYAGFKLYYIKDKLAKESVPARAVASEKTIEQPKLEGK